jgi:uncharacterized surface protein with fasciclin (FAS1) repeats
LNNGHPRGSQLKSELLWFIARKNLRRQPLEETTMKRISTAILALAACLPLTLAAPALAQTQDIVDVAAGNKDFTTLVAAGLVDTLKGKGPFTVFAPTDAAFKKLPAGTLEGLLKPEAKDKLASILKFHVVPGAYDAARLSKAKAKQYGLKSAQGSQVAINLNKGVVVSGATVTTPDIKASNGVIHVVDTVMLPRTIRAAMRAQEVKAKAVEKAAAMKVKVTEAAAALKAKAAETAAAAKAKATEMADKAKAAAGTAATPAPAKKP